MAEMIYRTELEVGNEIVNELLEVGHSTMSDLNVFRGPLRQARDCQ